MKDNNEESFEEWCSSYGDFEVFVGINRIDQRGAAYLAWDHQQAKIDELEKENKEMHDDFVETHTNLMGLLVTNEKELALYKQYYDDNIDMFCGVIILGAIIAVICKIIF